MVISVSQFRPPRPARPSRPFRRTVAQRSLSQPTSRLERLLLVACAALLPLEDHVPPIAGFSVMFFVFGILASYVLLSRHRALFKTGVHPVFLTGYGLLVLAYLLESSHPNSSYVEIVSIGQMLAGGICIACLCRDRQALRSCMYGYLIAGLALSIFLFLTSYGALQGATADDYAQADLIRAQVFKNQSLHINLNTMAFFTAQGAVVALAFALTAVSWFRRYLFFGVAALCLIGSFLPFSRGGIMIAIVSCALVTFVYGTTQGSNKHFNRFKKALALAIALGTVILISVPDAVFSRLTFSTEAHEGLMEGRAKVYTAAVEHLPEYVLAGVGEGQFWQTWGVRSQFAGYSGISGAHNGFIQVTIYWGVAGLMVVLGIVYQAYRCLPRRCGSNALSLSLLGVSVALLLHMMVDHGLAFKGFALGLGTLVGGRLWIWPRVVVRPMPRWQMFVRPSVRSVF